MKKYLTVKKVTRVLRIADIVRDMLSDVTDEELLEKYSLDWTQLRKVYCKLFYGGVLTKEQLVRRVELRSGSDSSHIPLADIEEVDRVYTCEVCGFASPWHFSACPRCHQVNLRRLKISSAGSFDPSATSEGYAGS
jgi:ribosomal protein L40E